VGITGTKRSGLFARRNSVEMAMVFCNKGAGDDIGLSDSMATVVAPDGRGGGLVTWTIAQSSYMMSTGGAAYPTRPGRPLAAARRSRL
jgi:hypothetical protein